ncbi:shufflon system plasmid conjugative transfer pilus tip adhesin PilV [Roseateles sp. SL47]|uniref:shufflon system plasmid conjugative transfer pilus tip adhesin PilV n=1 Tax=Roseateles sp. SL47 TaxID=2995138 RepID=UPI00226F939D|nr:shufflon system plasmid conjugative transfer pilus tip adhesin PilV [Roseateles sp. SL47]WAC74564.1 shufflon system plasmid conjugative transfer pilus tip adhesin PilV [Roseateles sp. SL47]
MMISQLHPVASATPRACGGPHGGRALVDRRSHRGGLRDRGVTLVEMLGALALLAILSAGATVLVSNGLDDTRGQHAGRHQATVVEATERYIREHYADLLTATSSGPVAVPITVLTDLLPAGFRPANAYGQTPCARIVQLSAGRLNALIVAEGGESIPAKDVAYVAAHAGPGGGQIATAQPGLAQGVFGSWQLDLAPYQVVTCGGASANEGQANRLASALFFDGPSSSAVDYLYRQEVPGHPELNAMNVPLGFQGSAVVVENDATDPRCSVGDPASQGRMGVSNTGALLSCQSGVWRRQGSAFWKDPVATATALPATDNQPGDVRLTLDTSRAFSWTGSAWKALAVDENGNLVVPGTVTGRYLQVTSTETVDAACPVDGLISRDVDGLLITCRDGRWRSQATQELAYTETGGSVLMRSAYMAYPAGTSFYNGGFSYDAPNDTVMASVERELVPVKDGLVITNVNASMNNGSVDGPPAVGQVTLVVQVIDRDTGNVIAANRAMSPRLTNDIARLAVTVSKAVPRNRNGYVLQMLTLWTTYRGSYEGNFYNRANYLNAAGQVVEQTPLTLDWSIDLTY